MILKDQNVFKAPVFLQIENPVPERPQHVFDSLRRQRGKICIVIRRLDDDLMGPNSVHAVEHSFGLPVQSAFNTQSRKLIGYHAHRPPRRVSLRGRSPIWIWTVSLDLGRSLALIAVAEGTENSLNLHSFANKIGWALRPVRRNNHPTSKNRIFSEIGR